MEDGHTNRFLLGEYLRSCRASVLRARVRVTPKG